MVLLFDLGLSLHPHKSLIDMLSQEKDSHKVTKEGKHLGGDCLDLSIYSMFGP